MEKKTVTIEQLYAEMQKIAATYPPPMIHKLFAETGSVFFALVATVLSARTQDKTTEKRLPELFAVIKTPDDLERIPEEELAHLLKPIGFYKTKAKHLKKLPSVLEREFKGVIPETIEDLVKLPGVGRKTANLIIDVCFGKEAICVDTHVHRIMNYIGYVKTKTPEETEMALRKKLPKHLWRKTNDIFVVLGQTVCGPNNITQPSCPLNAYKLIDT